MLGAGNLRMIDESTIECRQGKTHHARYMQSRNKLNNLSCCCRKINGPPQFQFNSLNLKNPKFWVIDSCKLCSMFESYRVKFSHDFWNKAFNINYRLFVIIVPCYVLCNLSLIFDKHYDMISMYLISLICIITEQNVFCLLSTFIALNIGEEYWIYICIYGHPQKITWQT